ncbi:hypothetical protein M885DRAFT_561233 [Pelagophyceae sp. CCMP2097]|nr:hypothetical protein M885DRAFT_561233 [Pelagophyceae sp. CCMP2097]
MMKCFLFLAAAAVARGLHLGDVPRAVKRAATKTETDQDSDAAMQIMAFQTTHNLWPEPLRAPGSTYTWRGLGAPRRSKHAHVETFAAGAAEQAFGSSRRLEQHKFETHVAAISTETSHLFVYGNGKYYKPAPFAHPYEKVWDTVPEVACLHVGADGLVGCATRFTAYTEFDVPRFVQVESSGVESAEMMDAMRLDAKLTSPPTTPANAERAEKMRAVVAELADCYGCASPEQLESVVGCGVKSCTIALPLQRLSFQGDGALQRGWCGQGGMLTVIADAQAGHHAVAFALVDVGGLGPGLLVAEFNEVASKLEKLILFRDFDSADERAQVLLDNDLRIPA